MLKFLRYASYVIRHKFFVGVECWKMGLYWQGITHDWHKFLPSEFFPYKNHFGDGIQTGRDKTGYYKPTDTGDPAFEVAWLKHQKRCWHHWQSWCVPIEGGMVKAYPIPDKYRMEMICDWIVAGRAQHKTDTVGWWEANRDKMTMHPETRAWFDNIMKFFKDVQAFNAIIAESRKHLNG